jgi:hypothetical protein
MDGDLMMSNYEWIAKSYDFVYIIRLRTRVLIRVLDRSIGDNEYSVPHCIRLKQI